VQGGGGERGGTVEGKRLGKEKESGKKVKAKGKGTQQGLWCLLL